MVSHTVGGIGNSVQPLDCRALVLSCLALRCSGISLSCSDVFVSSLQLISAHDRLSPHQAIISRRSHHVARGQTILTVDQPTGVYYRQFFVSFFVSMIALLECSSLIAFPVVVSRAISCVHTHSSLHSSSHSRSVAPPQRRHRQWVHGHFTNVSRARIQSRDQTHDCQCQSRVAIIVSRASDGTMWRRTWAVCVSSSLFFERAYFLS